MVILNMNLPIVWTYIETHEIFSNMYHRNKFSCKNMLRINTNPFVHLPYKIKQPPNKVDNNLASPTQANIIQVKFLQNFMKKYHLKFDNSAV